MGSVIVSRWAAQALWMFVGRTSAAVHGRAQHAMSFGLCVCVSDAFRSFYRCACGRRVCVRGCVSLRTGCAWRRATVVRVCGLLRVKGDTARHARTLTRTWRRAWSRKLEMDNHGARVSFVRALYASGGMRVRGAGPRHGECTPRRRKMLRGSRARRSAIRPHCSRRVERPTVSHLCFDSYPQDARLASCAH